MPDTKTIVTVVIGVAVLVIIAGSLDWLLKNPAILIVLAAAIGGLIYLLLRRKRARNRV